MLVITHSDVQAFLTCRRLSAWSDYRLPDKVSGPLALGRRVHEALEYFYRDGEDPLKRHEMLAARDLGLVETTWEEDQLFEDIIVGRNCLKAYMEWLADTGADSMYEIERVEHVVEAPFCDGEVLLRGRIDVLFRRKDNGALIVNDNKTVGRWSAQTRARYEKSWQHFIYSLALSIAEPDELVAESNYTLLRKVKRLSSVSTPMIDRFRVPGSTVLAKHKIEQLEVICRQMLAQPESLIAPEAYPCPSEACSWCDYRHPCEVADSVPEAAVAMLTDRYTSGRRHSRYDV